MAAAELRAIKTGRRVTMLTSITVSNDVWQWLRRESRYGQKTVQEVFQNLLEREYAKSLKKTKQVWEDL